MQNLLNYQADRVVRKKKKYAKKIFPWRNP